MTNQYQVSTTLLAEFEEAFNLFDKDEDKRLSAGELQKILTMLGQPPDQDELKSYLSDNTDYIELADFLDLMSRKMKDTEIDDQQSEAFQLFDRDGTDTITPEEFRYVISKVGGKIDLDEARDMLREAGGFTGNRRDIEINSDDFFKMMRGPEN